VSDAVKGLTEDKWKELQEAGPIDIKEVYRLVYFGGMAHSLRKKLWPMLLAGSTEPENPEKLRRDYEDRMSEWLAVEAIVRQKDRENMAINLAKLSSEGTFAESTTLPRILQTHESNEVAINYLSIGFIASQLNSMFCFRCSKRLNRNQLQLLKAMLHSLQKLGTPNQSKMILTQKNWVLIKQTKIIQMAPVLDHLLLQEVGFTQTNF